MVQARAFGLGFGGLGFALALHRALAHPGGMFLPQLRAFVGRQSAHHVFVQDLDGGVCGLKVLHRAGIDFGNRAAGLAGSASLGEGQAVDELIEGLAAALAKGRWQPNVDSESRRLALLPETLPQPWDELMLQPAYMQALDLLP